ncbi:MAG: 16S rRNA (cytosine967-C5)-methyltransferase [Paracoccaceae bacterium]|jgi:16S rRNA (cytosine967-C5)-methyltransferase
MTARRGGARNIHRKDAKPTPPPPRIPEGHAARTEALRLLAGVLDGGKMMSEMIDKAPATLAPADRARAGALAGAVLRRLGQADAALAPFLQRRPGGPVLHAMRMAVVEALSLGAPAHAAVDGAVAAIKVHPGASRFAALVNAVGRKATGEGVEVWEADDLIDAARLNTPGWLWGRLSSAYGQAAAHSICAMHLIEPPVDLTVHPGVDVAMLVEALGAEIMPGGTLRLARRPQITALPGFDEGAFWVQDIAAAQPARMLGALPRMRVLDLCAAPGGKTLQLAGTGAHVTALDINDRRLERVTENLGRTELRAEIICADVMEWEPDAPFDAILLDAPCSATGTVRRHPDLPHLKEAFDLKELTALQDEMLDRAWGWLAPGGRMVFSTCSLLPEEGEARAAAFFARTPDATRAPVDAAALGIPPEWVNGDGDLRLRPDFLAQSGGMDGFFACAMVRGG